MINRNEETTLDIGDLEVAEAQYGMVLFSLSPSDTELYIDGSQVDASQPITLEYGIHQIIAKADGYKSLTQYLRVGQESAGVDVQLDKADSDSEPPPQIRLRPITVCILMLRKMWRYIWTATMWEFPPAVLRRPQEVM